MKIAVGILVILILGLGIYFLLGPTESAEAPPENLPVEQMNQEMPAAEGTGEVREFTVEGGMFYFSPAEIEVNVGDTVRITFKNTEGMHDWVLDAFNVRTAVLSAGQEETIEFVASRAGTFEYYCSVGNHRAQGMVGNLIVK